MIFANLIIANGDIDYLFIKIENDELIIRKK